MHHPHYPPHHNKPFSSSGSRNKSKLFSSYGADDHVLKKGPTRDKTRPQSSRPACDKDGCPTDTHRGQTSLRHKSVPAGWVGTGVPHGNRKLDHTREFLWMPDSYEDPKTMVMGYRNTNSIESQHKRLSSKGFRLGNKPQAELFDPSTRGNAPNGTLAPDQRLMDWVGPGRAQHTRPFIYAAAAREKAEDRGYVGSHKHFPHPRQPFEDYESQLQVTQQGCEQVGHGFRPDHYTSSMGVPFKPTQLDPTRKMMEFYDTEAVRTMR